MNRQGMIRRSSLAASLALAVQPCLWPFDQAYAGHEIFHLFTPMIEKGHWGIEFNSGFQTGFPDHGDDAERADVRAAHEVDIHTDVTDFWMAKLALDFEREAGDDYAFTAIASENVFRLDKWTPRFFDAAWFTALSAAIDSEATNSVEFGPVLSLTSGSTALVLNPFFEKTFGQNREDGIAFTYAWRATYTFNEHLSIGVEGYGEVENIGNAPPADEQVHRVGPVLYLGPMHGAPNHPASQHAHGTGVEDQASAHNEEAEWFGEIGVLFGLTDSTADTAVKLNAGVHF